MATATDTRMQAKTRDRAREAMARTIRRGERRGEALESAVDVLHKEQWRGSRRPGSRALPAVTAVVAVLIGIVIVFSIAAVFGGPGWFEFGRCDDRPFSCGVLGGLVVTVLPLSVAYAWLVLWRVDRVRDRYVRLASEEPAELVEGAATVTKVVGRDDLCRVIMRDLQDRERRRPHVIVGGVGAGKTAVLVRLTELLAHAGAVPVPIRLREQSSGLNFRDQARDSFRRFAERRESASNVDEVWRKLRDRDLVVVLADGLEEALNGVEGRDSAIRLAINEAKNLGLPLVVTARPHEALNYLDAAILRLEPLAEAAARHYIEEGGGNGDPGEDRVERIVERAEVVEAPLYMQMARDLQRLGRLRRVDSRGGSRLVLRKRLVAEWTDQLIARRVLPEVPLISTDRERVVDTLSALACVGLRDDSLEVTFEQAAERLERLEIRPSEIKFAATAGAQLELVDARADAVRFRHSLMQSYLGARRIAEVITEPDFLAEPLADPGREVLMALAMACVGDGGADAADRLRPRLLEAAKGRRDVKAIELLGTAVEIDVAVTREMAPETAEAIREGWHEVTMQDEATLEAKLRVVARIGEGAAPRGRFQPTETSAGATYDALWHVCQNDVSYRVRHHAAMELGNGGRDAFARLQDDLRKALDQAEQVYRRNGAEPSDDELRRFSLSGWLLPLFIGSVDDARAVREAIELLSRWMELVGPEMHRGVEASFAQGFKYEANRRRRRTRSRNILTEHADVMLDRATFWYARASLFQALTLWGMRDEPEARGSAEARVQDWLGDDEHEFAKQTADLCVAALAEAQPSRYLWIDETGVASKVGPSATHQDWASTRRQWISPAVGWLALHPTARQLVGDIIILLNLAERGLPGEGDIEARAQREARLRRTERAVPLCLTELDGRAHLHAFDRDHTDPDAERGCVRGCKVKLCPLPPRGQPMFRGELRETFCRNQARLMTGREDKRAPWQRESREQLRTFWADMERRAQQA